MPRSEPHRNVNSRESCLETLKRVFAGEIERENEQNKKLETLTVE